MDDSSDGNILFQEYAESVYQFFRDKVGGEEDKLMQATFLEVDRRRDPQPTGGSFRAYLFSIARDQLYQHLRQLAGDANLDFSITPLATLMPSPTTVMAKDEHQAKLKIALRRIPLQQELAIELHYWQDMRAGELAQVFDVSEPGARLLLHRARHALRKEHERLR